MTMALSSTVRTFKKINSLKTLFNFSLLLVLFTSYVKQLKYMNKQYVYIFYIIPQKAAT